MVEGTPAPPFFCQWFLILLAELVVVTGFLLPICRSVSRQTARPAPPPQGRTLFQFEGHENLRPDFFPIELIEGDSNASIEPLEPPAAEPQRFRRLETFRKSFGKELQVSRFRLHLEFSFIVINGARSVGKKLMNATETQLRGDRVQNKCRKVDAWRYFAGSSRRRKPICGWLKLSAAMSIHAPTRAGVR